MKYTMKSYTTRYGGVTFRSRLEARWAAMFDLLGWKWDYEPIDFSGWIPDFAIYGVKPVYVEVKPVTEFPQDVADRIDRSGCPDEVLIVGMTCPLALKQDDTPYIGWLRERGMGWGFSPLGRWADCNGRIGFTHADGHFYDRISGEYDGGCYGNGEVNTNEITMLWREAGNRTQWHRKPPERKPSPAVYWRNQRHKVLAAIKYAGREFYLLEGRCVVPKSECIPTGEWGIFTQYQGPAHAYENGDSQKVKSETD